MSISLKIVWLSANLFGYEVLKEALKIKEVNIMAIITLDSEATTKMYDGIDINRWDKFNIPIHKVKKINDELKLLKTLNPDIIIMAGWRQMISQEIIDLPPKGFIGFHPSLLPEGRGPAPIINTILAGFGKSGLTMFYVDEGVDSGDIIGQADFDLDKDDYAMDVYYKVIEVGKKLIRKFLSLLIEGKAPKVPQDEKRATYFPKRSLKDNEIKLGAESPDQIYKKIRALSRPYNGAYIKLKDKKLIIWKAELKHEDKN